MKGLVRGLLAAWKAEQGPASRGFACGGKTDPRALSGTAGYPGAPQLRPAQRRLERPAGRDPPGETRLGRAA